MWLTWFKTNLRRTLSKLQRPSVWLKIATAIFGMMFVVMMLWDLTVPKGNLAARNENGIGCFNKEGNVLPELDDEEPVPGESIFFHETSCPRNNNDIHLNQRQACSIESALIAHPSKDVFLLISSPVFVPISSISNKNIEQLLTYPNFKIRHIAFSKYLWNTPMEVLDRKDALYTSLWPVAHASDVLRYTTLYKFGGIYLDLDVMVLKSMSQLENFAGAESPGFVGSGILGFGADAIGRKVATECADELASTYNGEYWGHNGPGVITRVLERRCDCEGTADMSKSSCRGFDVHSQESFSPIPFANSSFFFMEDKNGIIDKLLNRSYTVHFWNKISSRFKVGNRTTIPFVQYAKIYCPRVFQGVNGFF